MGSTAWPVKPKAYRWPDPDRGPYSLRLSTTLVEGRPQIVGVELWGDDPGRYAGGDSIPVPEPETAVTSVAVRLPLGALLARVLSDYSHVSDLIAKSPNASDELRASVGEHQAVVDSSPIRRGRSPLYGVPHYTRVARIYADAMAGGNPPTLAVAEWANVHKSTAANWVARARDLGLLPPTTRGRAAVVTQQRREER